MPLVAFLRLALLTPIAAASAQPAGPQIEQAWARAAPAGRTGALYFTLTDATPDTLTGVATPVAASASLHRSVAQDGVMRMLPVASLDVGPGAPVTLAPGGIHVMLFDLKQALRPGDSFPVTLRFAHAAPVTVTATVTTAGATAPGAMPMPMPMQMQGHDHVQPAPQ